MNGNRAPSGPHVGALSATGFGGLLAHGGGALEIYSFRVEDASLRDARVRVAALGGFEQGILALAACGAAIWVLTAGLRQPPVSFTMPWCSHSRIARHSARGCAQ